MQSLPHEDVDRFPVPVREPGCDEDLPALGGGELGERRRLHGAPELGPRAQPMLASEDELGVGEQEATAVAEDAGGSPAGGLVSGAIGANELFRFASVVLEARTIRKLTHDESPFGHARRPLPRAKEVSSCASACIVQLGGVGTSLPADRLRLRALLKP